MASLEPRADAPPPPPCPVCGLPATGTTLHELGSIRMGNYCCPMDHIWTTRWLAVA